MACTNRCQRHAIPYVALMCCCLVVAVILTGILNNSTDNVAIGVVHRKSNARSGESVDVLQNELDKTRPKETDVFNPHKDADLVSMPCIGKQTDDDHRFKEVFQDVFVYSAFLDERDNDVEQRPTNGVHTIRIMAILSSPERQQNPILYCVGLLASGQYWSARVIFYVLNQSLNRDYVGYILSCRLPRELWHTPPCSVLVSSSVSPTDAAQWIKVHSSVTKPQHNFEVCVPPLFGDISQLDLIEFIELVRLFGAEQVHFYDYKATPSVMKVLQYYEKRGVVTVLPWKLDSRLEGSKHLHYNGQIMNIQDCLYRHMFSTRFLAFMDTDEMFVPKHHSDWMSMMTSVKNYNQLAGILASSVFFDPQWQQATKKGKDDVNRPVRISRLTHIIRTSHTCPQRSKVIVNPRHIFEITVHYVKRSIVAHMKTVRLPDSAVLLYHYRSCAMPARLCLGRVADTTLLSYVTPLETAVSRALANLAV